MKIKKLIAALLLLVSSTALADETTVLQLKDTVRLDEVIVTGTMPKVNLRNVPMSITVVSEKQIQNRLESSLLPLLNEEVPGLFITQRGVMGYGVANGAAGGMNIRGVGGAPTAGVLILIDGHPQYMGLMGHPLADSYQSMMTERVEVVRGPASVLYGSNAMGGVINIITRKQQNEGYRGSARVMYGSYNSLSSELSNGWKKGKLHLTANIGYNRSDGHRKNMDFEQYNAFGKIGYDFSKNWSGFADLNLSKTFSSNPGTVAAPLIDNDADVLRGVTSFVVENNYSTTSGAVKLFHNFGTHKINDGYTSGGSPLPYRFNSTDAMTGFSAYQSYKLFDGNNSTLGFDYQQFGGKAWNKFNDDSADESLADIHLKNYAFYFNTQQAVWQNRATFNAGIRMDNHEINGTEWIPQAGISYTPSASTVIKAIASKGFRNPTIREMYMFPPQNPDLKAEKLLNYEVSLLQMLLENRLKLELNLFYIDGENMIVVEPVNGRPLNVNTGKVENKGFEVSSTFQANQNLQLSANYSFLQMKHKIVGAPEHKLYLSGNYAIDRWSFSSGIQYISGLYKEIRPEPVTERFLLWHVRANYKLSENINIFMKGENLLNQKYEINAGFPMPGATVFGGIQLHL